MSGACSAFPSSGRLVKAMLDAVDCRVQAVVEVGYQNLLPSGGMLSSTLMSLLVILIALLGFSLISGRGDTRLNTLAALVIKIGVVLAVTTQWSLYQLLVYNTLFHGPEQLAARLLPHFRGAGLLNGPDIIDQLQQAYRSLLAAAKAQAQAGGPPPLAINGAETTSPAPEPISPQTCLTFSAIALLVGSLGVLVLSKIVLGVLLCVGPIFIACALFRSAQGFFEGWLRAVVGVGLAPLLVTLLLILILPLLDSLMEPLRAAGPPNLDACGLIALICLVFLLGAFGLVFLGCRIGSGFRLPSIALVQAGQRVFAAAAPASAPAAARETPGAAIRSAMIAASQNRRDDVGARRGRVSMTMSPGAPAGGRIASRTGTIVAGVTTQAVRSAQPSRRSVPLEGRGGGRAGPGVEL